MTTIRVDSLTKRFDEQTTAVDDLSFTVEPGKVTGFLGPNGAGKTTTLRVLLGLVAPTAGSATFDGRPYRELKRPLETAGAVLERSGFHPGRSGRDHLRVLARAAGFARSRVDELLAFVGLSDAADRRVGGYSLGMRQRLALAAALLGDPPALVLDEPANGLDPQAVRWLRDFLRAQADSGRTVLVSSHALAEVAQTVDEVVVIDRGRLIAHTPLAELTRRTGASVRVRSPEAERLAGLLRERGHRLDGTGDDQLVVLDSSPEAVGAIAAEHGIAVHELSTAAPTLEDVFLELTGSPPSGSRPGAAP